MFCKPKNIKKVDVIKNNEVKAIMRKIKFKIIYKNTYE